MKNTSILKRAIALVLSSVVSLSLCSCDFSDYTEQTSASTSESTRSTQSTSRTTQTTATTRTTKTTSTTETTSTTQKPPKQEEILTYDIVSENIYLDTTDYGSTYIFYSITVQNTGNTNLYLNSLQVDIEDTDGHLIDTKDYINAYPQVIAPGEKAVYFETFSFDEDPEGNYNAVPYFDIEKAKVPLGNLEVSDVSIKETSTGRVSAVGRVKNTTSEEQSLAKIAIILYDSNDKVIDVFDTYLDTMQPDEKISFSVSSFGSHTDDYQFSDIARWEAIAFIHQYQFDWN